MTKRAGFGVIVALVALLLVGNGATAQPRRGRSVPDKHPVIATSLLDEAGLGDPSGSVDNHEAPAIDRRGRIRVAIDGDVARIAGAVERVGGAEDSRADRVVTAFVPRDRLVELADAPGVASIRQPAPMRSHVESAGVAETGMTAWHTAGQQGAGVTVAIVDIGFANYQAHLGTELPPTVQTIDDCQGSGFQGDNHGTAVAEIVHDMAPAAALVLVCVEDDGDIDEAVTSLQNMGVRVVNASIGCALCARGDGTGVAGAAMRQARLANMLWSVSAGNDGDGHFSFVGTGVNGFGSVLIGPNNPTYSITIQANQSVSVDVKWDAWPTTSQDFDIYLYSSQANYEAFIPVARSIDAQVGTPPVESFVYTNNTGATRTFLLEIFPFDDPTVPPGPPSPVNRRFDIFVGGGFASVEAVTGGSVSDPATSPYVMTVGAYDVGTGAVEAFSSRGPTIDGRVKPDISGPDHVATAELPTFFGTSAAAPHLAGAAAVMLGANPNLDAAEIQSVLERRSLDAGAQGLDNNYGFGRLRMGTVGMPAPPAGDLYVAVDPPVRVVDTRLTSGCGVACGAVGPGQVKTLNVAGQILGNPPSLAIPADATAVVFNVTAVTPTAPGFVTVFPAGTARPTVSNLNTLPGQIRPNNVTATVGPTGGVSFYNAAGNTHLVVDLAGYYSPSAGNIGLVPLNPPTRPLDTGGGAGRLGPQETRVLPLAGLGPIAATAQAVVLNVTVVQPTAGGFLTVWPGGSSRPGVSSLNFAPGQIVPNLVIATLGGGAVQIYNSTGNTRVIVDVLGYYDTLANAPGAGRYVALPTPRRNLDTRSGNGLIRRPLAAGETFPHQTRMLYGVPSDAIAALMNVTVANPSGGGFLTIFPEGVARPPSSNLNFVRGQTVPNAVISSVGAGTGRVNIYNGGSPATPVLVDIAGYFAPSA
jgi:hypothetical protein